MTLKELKEFINRIPKEMDDFKVVNGEYGLLTPNDYNSVVYRVDNTVMMINVIEEEEQVVFLHQSSDDLNKLKDGLT